MDIVVTTDLAHVARELGLPVDQVQRTVELLDEGNTVPFITRYRKDQTGGFDEEQVRRIQAGVSRARMLAERKQTILRSIESQGKLDKDLAGLIKGAQSTKRLEDLYLPYKPKKQTLATTARQRGLQPLADEVLGASSLAADLDLRAGDYLNPDVGLFSKADVLLGVGHLLAENFCERAELRSKLRRIVRSTGKMVSVRAMPPEEAGGNPPVGERKPPSTAPSSDQKAPPPTAETPPAAAEIGQPGENSGEAALDSADQTAPSDAAPLESTDPAPPPGIATDGTAEPPTSASDTAAVPAATDVETPQGGEPPAAADTAPANSADATASTDPTSTDPTSTDPTSTDPTSTDPATTAPDGQASHLSDEAKAEVNSDSTAPPVSDEAGPDSAESAPETPSIDAAEPSETPAADAQADAETSPAPDSAPESSAPESAPQSSPPESSAASAADPTVAATGAPAEPGEQDAALASPADGGGEQPVASEKPVEQAGPSTKGDSGETPPAAPAGGTMPSVAKAEAAPSQAGQSEKAKRDKKKKKKSKKEKEAERREKAFKDYFDFREDLSRLLPHRILAMNRGERAKVLRVRIDCDTEQMIREAEKLLIAEEHPHADFLCGVIRDALTRLLLPSLEREVRRELTERAETHAVEVFARNLRHLLLSPPLQGRRVLAIDPGFRSGCKMAALDEFGNVLGHGVIHFVGREERRRKARYRLAEIIGLHRLSVVAIGNGTACRDVEQLVADVIASELKDLDVRYCVVNGAGASVYSTSGIGREELPDYDATLRSAISIGRRLLDPLSELVKINPSNIGVGLYQHDVKSKHLRESLDAVVESCVNFVGVDVNTASPALLRYVSGLNQLTARRLYDYRLQKGPFKSREELKSVLGFGAATFVQAAGFLKIHGGDNPLDITWIHPESYDVARQVLSEVNSSVADLPATGITPPAVVPAKEAPPTGLPAAAASAVADSKQPAPEQPAVASESTGDTAPQPTPDVAPESTAATAPESPPDATPESITPIAPESAPESVPMTGAPEPAGDPVAPEATESVPEQSSPDTPQPVAPAETAPSVTDQPVADASPDESSAAGQPDGASPADSSPSATGQAVDELASAAVTVGGDGTAAPDETAATEGTTTQEPAPAETPSDDSQPSDNSQPSEQPPGAEAGQVSTPRVDLAQRVAQVDADALAAKLEIGKLLLRDVLAALARPGRDPRDDLPGPIFRRGIVKIDDLEAGMELAGTVLNVVDFGVFVDIGLNDSALIHVSRLADRYVRDPHDVVSVGDIIQVWVVEVDKQRRRVSLTAIKPGTERPADQRRGKRSKEQPKPSGPPRDRAAAKRTTQGSRPRPQGGRGRPERPRGKPQYKPQYKPRPKPKPVVPITKAMKEGREPMRTFGDLQQFFQKQEKDQKKAPPKDKPAKAEPPKDEQQPKDEQPKVEQPKIEPAEVEQPKVEQPKIEPTEVEQPKVEQPKVEQPKDVPPKDEQPSGAQSKDETAPPEQDNDSPNTA